MVWYICLVRDKNLILITWNHSCQHLKYKKLEIWKLYWILNNRLLKLYCYLNPKKWSLSGQIPEGGRENLLVGMVNRTKVLRTLFPDGTIVELHEAFRRRCNQGYNDPRGRGRETTLWIAVRQTRSACSYKLLTATTAQFPSHGLGCPVDYWFDKFMQPQISQLSACGFSSVVAHRISNLEVLGSTPLNPIFATEISNPDCGYIRLLVEI